MSEIGPNPSFSWSFSRARVLNDCERRYYWQYYGSHRGWLRDPDVGPDAKLAYRLKQLSTPELMLGSEIHTRAEEIAVAYKMRKAGPTLDEMVRKTEKAMYAAWRTSREVFIRSPKRNPMFLEHYYGGDISNARRARLRAKLDQCLHSLFRWPGWTDVAAADPETILVLPKRTTTMVAGVPIYAAPDLAFRNSSGELEIIEWKTGNADGAEAQVYAYAFFLRHFGVAAETFRGRVVQLADGSEREFEVTKNDIATVMKRFRDDVWSMKGFVLEMDTERNEAGPVDRFRLPPTEDACTWCPFYEVCQPQFDAVVGGGPF